MGNSGSSSYRTNEMDTTDSQRAHDITSSKQSIDHTDSRSGSEALETDPMFKYDMNYPQRGCCVIINNKNFDKKRTGMSTRNGTDKDAENLRHMFSGRGFQVELMNDLTSGEIVKQANKYAMMDHSPYDCFVMCILSHGDQGLVYGTDGIVHIDAITQQFRGNHCRSLAGKPKIFIIQACRGTKLDHGVTLEAGDSQEDERVYRIPSEADFLFAYSTVPGYFSWRNSSNGSWFVQALDRAMKQYGDTLDFVAILTRVNAIVAYEFESNASRPEMTEKKQIPSIVSMLTKQLYLKKK